MKSFFTLFAFFVATCMAAPTVVTPPWEDDFYNPPEGFESAPLGTVLKFRKTPHELRAVYLPMEVKNAWQILFKSETAKGNHSAVVGTLIEPNNANNSRLVTYSVMEDAANLKCAPSYAIQYGAPAYDTLITQAEMYLLGIVLQQGSWALTIDYEGPQSSFTAGINSGQNILNGIRSIVNSLNETGLNPDFETILWGYSGGSLASIWTASLLPTYAKDLESKIIGAAVGGLVTNITTTIQAVDGTLYAGLIPNGIHGLSNEYPELQPLVDQKLPDNLKERFDYVSNQCLLPAVIAAMYTPIFKGDKKWVPSGYDVFSNPVVIEVLKNNTLGIDKTLMPKIPIFVYHGTSDGIVPYINTERIYDTWCNWGIGSLEVAASESTRHITEAITGAPAATAWIANRFDHVAPVQGCSLTKRYNNLLYPGVTSQVIDLVEAAAKDIFGLEAGPGLGLFKRGETIDFDEIVENRLHEMYKRRKRDNFADNLLNF